ncbi:hypothetical protein BD410DRAFT_250777 [Rickenella mellea]|uniref:Uncharacterized protein n=1 Tax=Rickenella mellea TaxID=50990 RepID=A0A4Y7QMK5_9AGAM|nr:hypothetical protein BD410DRAFT_250777 [Rickenella mellea]
MAGRRIFGVLTISAAAITYVQAGNVTWSSPSSGDIFSSGGTIVGKWTAEKPLTSPSFSLCAQGSSSDSDPEKDSVADSGSCGAAVWPAVTHSGETYSISLAVPNVTDKAPFYLRMKDDFGNVIKSPAFILSPTEVSNDESSTGGGVTESPVEDSSDDPAPPPDGSSDHPSSPQAILHGSGDYTGSSGSMVSSATVLSSSPATSSGGILPTVDNLPVNDATNPQASAPKAAVAIPLALVGMTLLASLLLCIQHRRSLAKQSERNAQILSRNSSVRSKTSTGSSVDIEKAISALSACPAASVPHHPVPRADVRRERMNAYDTYSLRDSRFSRSSTPGPNSDTSQFRPLWDDDTGTVTDSIVADYLQASPVVTPESLNGISYLDMPQEPPRLHHHPIAPDHSKPLPPSPMDLYDAVARAVRSPRADGVRLL